MKYKLLIAFVLTSIFTYAQEDYEIEIDGKTINIELGKKYDTKINDKLIRFKVSSKDTLIFQDDMLGFKYPKEYKISNMVVEQGIEQLMLMTAGGSGFIIQKYSTIDPTLLNEMMMNEVIKESLSYGFTLKREDYERTLKSGKTLSINRAVLTYKDEINTYEIASIGKKDEGLILLTIQMDHIGDSAGAKLIKMIWDTLEIY
jgi:hypothetical protein